MKGLLPAKVHNLRREGASGIVLSLSWKPAFQPGQYVGLTTDPDIPPRLYSAASQPGDEYFQILFTRVEDGALTPHLSELRAGQEVLVQEPEGSFLPAPGRNLWIATGTGIAPFVSMIGLVSEGYYGVPPILLQSARLPEDLYFRPQFLELAESASIEYHGFATQAKDRLFGLSAGRLTGWLKKAEPGMLKSLDRIMICGSTGMILDVRDILLERGVDFHRIVSEVYF